MLEFVKESDFTKVNKYEQTEDGSVLWEYEEEKKFHSGLIEKNFIRDSGNGEGVHVWDKLVELDKAGKIKVNWLTDADRAAIELEKQLEAKRQAKAIEKLQGVLINGEQISLTEENQNGMAAVMQGVNLAAEMGADIFPLNFNAQTPAGFKLITFKAAADFKNFCLTFMAERQKFFK